jgi:hypothetical protein
MSAAALLGVVVVCLGLVFALAVWGVCLIAGAARPVRRQDPAQTDLLTRASETQCAWRPRAAGAKPRPPSRAIAPRRSRQALWRD